MQALVFAGLLALCGTSVAVGVKLLRLAQRTQGVPERSLGLFFLLGAGVGFPLSALSTMAGEWQGVLAALSSVFTGASQVLLFLFTARVFCAGERRGRVGVALGLALVAVYVLGTSIAQLTAETPEAMLSAQMTWGGVSLVMSAAAYGWTGLESLRHHAQHRRRLALGLADPVVTDRMLLWGLMGLTTLLVILIDAVLLYTLGAFARTVAIPLVTCTGGLAVGALLLLAFFPPASYLERVRRQAATAAVPFA